MAKVDPYYSINPTDPDVWHDKDNCPSGQQIPLHNKRPGKGPNGTYRKCEHCKDMD
jgi:hypothetical protein